jgi:hypothetical protein
MAPKGSVVVMDWVEEATANWVRILSAEDGDETPLDEAMRQLSTVFEAPASGAPASGAPASGVPASGAPASGRSLRRRKPAPVPSAEAAAVTPAAAEAAVTALSRQLVAGVLVSELMLAEVCAVTGRPRDQVLDQLLSGGLGRGLGEGRLRLLVAELSGSCTQLREPGHARYSGLGARIEQLLGLAAEQASALVDAARAEAAKTTAPANTTASVGPRPPCPNCGAS